jgi:uncharacterized protein YfbU (UPF0304 family)
MNAQAMTERFEMRLGPSVLEGLDSWRARQEDLPSRSEAVRRLVEAGLGVNDKKRITLGSGEKLILMMLCQLFRHLNVKSDFGPGIDPAFVEEVIYGGHHWALDWGYPGIFGSHEDSAAVVTEVLDVLDMWNFLERGFRSLSKTDRDKVAAEAQPFGEHVELPGFDGNGEGEYIGVAKFLIDRLDRFPAFKGRDVNAHCPMLDTHRRMFSVFEPMRKNLIGRELNAPEIIQILKEWVHPSRRKS